MTRIAWTMAAAAALALATGACAKKTAEEAHGHPHDDEPWAVTSWGQRFEIFAEAAPLAAGETVKSHTHVTILAGFKALETGTVSAVLTDSTGATQVFAQREALRPGIYSIEITPKAAGSFELMFVVEADGVTEEIHSGRVRVGSHEDPGGLIEQAFTPPAGAATGGEAVPFLKEQQWRIPFATEWAEPGALQPSVTGPGRVRPAAGGEVVLTASLDGTVDPASRLFVGREVERGASVVRLRPRVGSGRSFAEIESETKLATERLERLERLFEAGAVSRAELDRAREHASTLSAERAAVRGTGRAVPVTAPFSGHVAEVMVTPGQAVDAGASLARLVRTDPLWVEIGLRSETANLSAIEGLVVHQGHGEPPATFRGGEVHLVSRAPEVDRATGLVPVLVEVRGASRLRPGTTVQAELLLTGSRAGIVVPSESIVDDAGVPVMYAQEEGESFVRREVAIVGRQGDRALVRGIVAGERVVTRGAAAIRRASQMSSGQAEGHVH